jgi:hypothetical protein
LIIAELFSAEPAENVLAALCLGPERVIYLGSRSLMTDGRIAATRAFFRARRPELRLSFLRVDDRDYSGAAAAIRDILEKYPDCAFEMTGGSDLLLAALGSAAAQKRLRLFELDVRRQSLHTLRGELPARKEGLIRPLRGIRAGEYIRLSGGELTESSYTLSGKLPEDLEKDVEDLWSVYVQDPGSWTKQCTLLAELTARSRSGGLTVSASMPEKCARRHIERLEKAGLISAYGEKGSIVTLTFRDQHVKRTLTRAGDLLELWVFLAARESGFTDAVMGAKIGWNGSDRGGTSNEIDGLLMYGAVPLYVSCKLGAVPKEALYEVDTVASRFGGEYAVKALVCSRLGGPDATRETLRQRAGDMGILLIEDVDRLSRAELAARLRTAALEGVAPRLRPI